MSVLSEILAAKRTEVDCARRRISYKDLQNRVFDLPPALDFRAALIPPNSNSPTRNPALIAEVKKASPSKGVMCEDFDPVEIAQTYAANGASCISVLTDEPFFQGHLSHLTAVGDVVDLPLLRKDFIIDDYQLLEARAAGADAVLMIMAALTQDEMERMLEATAVLGMAALVEVHDAAELDQALEANAQIIGINNRDLHTFRTTLQTTIDLIPRVPLDRIIVSESGINHREDVVRLSESGVHAVLVGEALVRERDIAAKMRELLGT